VWVRESSQFDPHFVAGTETERFVEGATFGAGVEDDEIDVIRLAPVDGGLHQSTGETSAAEFRFGVDIQNVPTTRAGSDHVRRPVHEPEAGSRDDLLTFIDLLYFVIDGQPGEVVGGGHLCFHPRKEFRRHGIEMRLVVVTHVAKHLTAVASDRRGVVKGGGAEGDWAGIGHRGVYDIPGPVGDMSKRKSAGNSRETIPSRASGELEVEGIPFDCAQGGLSTALGCTSLRSG
jgi:hypothetical protein